jgi:serine protease Do
VKRAYGPVLVGLLITLTGARLVAQESAQSKSENAAAIVRGTLLSPKAFRAAAARVQPSLVRIEGFGGVAGSVGSAGFQPPGEGPTTGLIISSDGYIVTSTFNFIRKPPVITVVLPSGERKVAKLLGRDETRKICILKVEGAQGLQPADLLPRDDVKVGQWAIALGVGFGGKQPALSAGIISAAHRISDKAVQTDANLSPANYGGPLIDLDGHVIGLCVPLSPQSREEAAGAEWYDSGIGFAIPLAENAERIEALKQGKNFHPPFLGVQAKAYGEPARGVQVVEVVAGSPAANAQLQKDDILISLNDAEPLDPTHLSSLVGRYLAGDTIQLKYRRADEILTAEIELAVLPADAPKPPKPKDPTTPPNDKLPPKDDAKPAQPS